MMRKLRTRLSRLAKVISDKAEQDPHFAEMVEAALGASVKTGIDANKAPNKRPRGRRTPAVLDPIASARNDASSLPEALGKLDIEQLKDIVAEYGMDPSKLVMKWKDPNKIADRIVEVSISRASKGQAFRPD